MTAGDTGGSWKLPGSKTSISFSSYVKGDFYLDSADDLGKAFDPTSIRLDGVKDPNDDDGAVGVHAEQSRLRFDTHTPTEMGALNTRIETDFWGGDLRLRQAYGSLGPVLAGQAWSTVTPPPTRSISMGLSGLSPPASRSSA